MGNLSIALKRGLVLTAVILGLFPFNASAGQCYIGKNCFAVASPFLVQRACFLYFHEVRAYKPGIESPGVVSIPGIDLHPDQLHFEFLQMMQDNKVLSLRKGTPVFSCRYDLATLKTNPDRVSLVGGPLPEFNCRGFVSRWVPVRVINIVTPYWVALEDVQCEEQTPSSLTFQQTDEPGKAP